MLQSTLKKAAFFVFFLGSITAFTSMRDVLIQAQSVHVPKGFDSNDVVEVIVAGHLPNTCYRRPMGITKIVKEKVDIAIKATLVEKNVSCIMALVPYMISVPLGHLNEGDYSIAVNPGTNNEKFRGLFVDMPSSESIDNFTYANVTSVKAVPNSPYVAIKGSHPSSCMHIERVDLVANPEKDTFAVLPIISQIKSVCDQQLKPFVHYVKLPSAEHKNIVVHVRKLDGTAINLLVNNS